MLVFQTSFGSFPDLSSWHCCWDVLIFGCFHLSMCVYMAIVCCLGYCSCIIYFENWQKWYLLFSTFKSRCLYSDSVFTPTCSFINSFPPYFCEECHWNFNGVDNEPVYYLREYRYSSSINYYFNLQRWDISPFICIIFNFLIGVW